MQNWLLIFKDGIERIKWPLKKYFQKQSHKICNTETVESDLFTRDSWYGKDFEGLIRAHHNE